MRLLVLSATASGINYRNSLAGRADVELYMTDASRFAAGLYAPHVRPLLVPRASQLESYRAALDRIIGEHQIDALVPTSDADVDGVMELLHRGWDPPVRMFRPDYETFRVMQNKSRLMEALKGRGFDIPETYAAADAVRFPAVVKPVALGGSKGVWIVQDARELEDRVNAVRSLYRTDVLIQEYIPGGIGSIHVALLLYDDAGELRGEMGAHSHLTFMTWGGGGNAGIVVDQPELLERARAIVESLGGWRGPINLEFKRDERTGSFRLMEVNCRLNGYSYLGTMNGLNFPSAVVDLLQTGSTQFLTMDWKQPPRNFLIAFREKPVKGWLA